MENIDCFLCMCGFWEGKLLFSRLERKLWAYGPRALQGRKLGSLSEGAGKNRLFETDF